MIDNNSKDFKNLDELKTYTENLISQDKNKLLKELIKNKTISQETNQSNKPEKESTTKKKWYVRLFNILK